ncbi:cytochrome b/b6 domain-containing protein [Aeromonas enteropelogenes]|uniref:cytochrome b/b6 domain-containing protein n=1 Tax=Aeromonas enteropelogenes TaxID=29489 RepID=UPI0005A9B0E2|nr:cytochrome b/b6 domain-containing protein [Aeromonas enteropelogenes]UBH52995.1 cytochrome b/b6 domain-containing protein [Aeromonas enteropelogenes]
MTNWTETRVWDPVIRVFHWLTVTLCLLNFFVLEEGSRNHRYVGYTLGALLLIRLLWGLFGSYYARFGQWWPTPARVRAYLRQLLQGRHPYYLGHNPVGALMIWLLLLSLLGTIVTGWLTTWDAFWGEDWLEELHGVIANTLMAAVGVHAAVVILTDRLTRSDLLRAMVLGKKRVPLHVQVEDPRNE